MRVRIASRQSDLARLQAYMVAEALKKNLPDCEVEFQFRASLGDINQHDPLWKMPEKGVFTEDFVGDLIDGRCDMVVHSWKDLPTEERPHTEIAATLPRADARDLFLLRRDRLERLGEGGLRILTSSPRRAHNLGGFFQEYLPRPVRQVEFVNVRGNIPTRVRKLFDGDADGLILAKAALDRLLSAPQEEFREVQEELRERLARCQWMVLPLALNPAAAAQGALAIEIRKGRQDVRAWLEKINCPATFAAVEEERRILKSYGGGCHQKIGVSLLKRPFGDVLYLRGLTDRGEVLDGVTLRAPLAMPVAEGPDRIWPAADGDGGFFAREALPESQWRAAREAGFLWIARETAVPETFTPASNQIVWTAGLRTWRKLAARGIWVHGSAEGLGEREPARLEALVGSGEIAWRKLTHDRGRGAGESGVIPTYRLVPKGSGPDLNGKTHFFWMSGTAFDRAFETNPGIAGAWHACGPGHTYEHLRARLGAEAKIAVFLNAQDWRSRVLTPGSGRAR